MRKPDTSRRVPTGWRRDLVGYGEFAARSRLARRRRTSPSTSTSTSKAAAKSTLANGDEVSEGMLNDIGVPTFSGRRVPLVGIRVRVRQPARRLAPPRHLRETFRLGQRARRRRARCSRTRPWRRPASIAATRSSATAIAGSTTGPYRKRSSASTSGTPSTAYGAHRRKAARLDDRPAGTQHAAALAEAGGFLYDRDSLPTNCPTGCASQEGPHLVIPYSYETNDNRFNENSGFSTAEHFFAYMRDAFDLLYARASGARRSSCPSACTTG